MCTIIIYSYFVFFSFILSFFYLFYFILIFFFFFFYCFFFYCFCFLFCFFFFFFFSSRRRHTRFDCDWSSDVCSSDLRARRAGSARTPPRNARCARFPPLPGKMPSRDSGISASVCVRSIPAPDRKSVV